MSTCRGAAPPHENCVHGKNCDWVPPLSAQAHAKAAAEQEAIIRAKYPNNRQGRRAMERDLKKRGNR